MTFGFPCRWLATVDSTNEVAREWALRGAPHGACVIAAHQTSGRGRREHRWESPRGAGLYASFILRPNLSASQAPQLAIWAAMTVFYALEKAGIPHLSVKWPNDILASGKKIAGILIEPRIGVGDIEFAVVGIGINIAQQLEDFSPELHKTATSCHLDGASISVDEAWSLLVESWKQAQTTPLEKLRDAWRAAGANEKEPVL